MRKVKALYQLSRITIVFESYIPLVALAMVVVEFKFDFNFLILAVVMLLIFVFTFMINDIEDAEDDAKDEKKRLRNPISAEKLSKTQGYIATGIVGLLTIGLLIPLGLIQVVLGLSALITGFLYSWKQLRFKNLPILDVLSHAYFLGGIQLVMFGLLLEELTTSALLIAGGVFIFSIGGDLHNEIRDWEVDRKAKLNNTAHLIGKQNAQLLKLIAWVTGIIFIIVGITIAIAS